MKRIAVIGSLNVDYVSYVSRYPEAGETILADKMKIVPGGKGANQAYALGRMGANAAMFGALGSDSNAEVELESLKSAGVDTSHILRTESPTGVAMIIVDGTGDNSIIVAQGANADVSADYIESKMPELEKFDIIVLQLEIPMDTVTHAVQRLKGLGKTIIFDPAPAVSSLPEGLLENVDYLKPNENELYTLTGIADTEAACDELLSRGVGCVLASLGSAGVLVKRAGEPARSFPVEKVKAVDTTAAGDSFIAAFAYALANSAAIDKAVRFANSVATLVVQREGAQQSIPSRGETDAIWQGLL